MPNRKTEIITRRLKRNPPPSQVIGVLDELFAKHSVSYQRFLWKLSSLTVEFEHEGVLHSDPLRNQIEEICRKYPMLKKHMSHDRTKRGEGRMCEEIFRLCNFREEDLVCDDTESEGIVREILGKIPQTYTLNEVEIFLDGVDFLNTGKEIPCLRRPESGFGACLGSYIYYSRSVYGTERHSYVQLAFEHTEEGKDYDMFRKFCFDFAELIPGSYDGTEIQWG